MPNTNKVKRSKRSPDPIPDTFASEEEAGDFWDTHSTTDYLNYLEPADHKISIRKRTFEVQVEEDVYRWLQGRSKSLQTSVPNVLDHILRGSLETA